MTHTLNVYKGFTFKINLNTERRVIALDNESYVKRLGEIYHKVMDLRTDDNYVVNQPQMEKLTDVLNFFLDMSNKCNGEVEPVALIPKEEHGGVTAKFVVFDIFGDDIQRFCEVIKHTSALTIDSELDNKICISVTVPEVFVPKNTKN